MCRRHISLVENRWVINIIWVFKFRGPGTRRSDGTPPAFKFFWATHEVFLRNTANKSQFYSIDWLGMGFWNLMADEIVHLSQW